MKNTLTLKKKYDFKKALNYGKFSRGKYVVIYVLNRKDNNNQNLFGICVSKKHGNSVVRNRLKRWSREAYKEIEDNLILGNIIIILYKKDIKQLYDDGKLNYRLIQQDINEQFKNIGLIKEDE